MRSDDYISSCDRKISFVTPKVDYTNIFLDEEKCVLCNKNIFTSFRRVKADYHLFRVINSRLRN